MIPSMRPARPLIDQILTAHRPGEPAVLGTLVDLEGSGYRRPGARLLIQPDGRFAGAISGGCLERDLARNAFAVTADGPALVRIDTRSGLFGQADHYGTGCDGVVHLLLERLDRAAVDPLALIAPARAAGLPQTIVTAFDGGGAWGGLRGTLAWLTDARPTVATPCPAPLAAALRDAMADARAAGQSQGVLIRRGADHLRALVEVRPARPELVIVGTGPDAAALIELARPLGWRVRVLGGHPLALADLAAPDVRTQVVPARPTAAELRLHADAYVLLMSHSLALDGAILPLALHSAAPYVGLLGPRRRAGKLMARLHAAGALPAPALLDKLASPVGLDLGGDDPTAVALAILAEVVARRNGRAGGAITRPRIHPDHRWIELHLDAAEACA